MCRTKHPLTHHQKEWLRLWTTMTFLRRICVDIVEGMTTIKDFEVECYESWLQVH